MPDLPRYSTNTIMMSEIDDDLEDEEQPLATDPEGDWVKWADVSSRLQQLEDRKREAECDAQSALEGTHAAQWDRDQALRANDDLKARVEQLEQEKVEASRLLLATMDAWSDKGQELEARAKTAEGALAETREALHQLQEKYAKLDQLVRMTLKMASTTDVSDVSSEEFNAMDELATSLGYVVP